VLKRTVFDFAAKLAVELISRPFTAFIWQLQHFLKSFYLYILLGLKVDWWCFFDSGMTLAEISL